MDVRKRVIVASVVLIVVVVILYFASSFITKSTGYGVYNEKEELVNCLLDKNAKLYVKEGCSDCLEQEKLFGSSYAALNVVSCDNEKDVCEPPSELVWVIDDQKYYGLQSLDSLREISECN